MGNSCQVLRPAGNTVPLSVSGSSHAAVTITATINDLTNAVALFNSGTTLVAVTMGQKGSTPASVFPVDPTSQPVIVLPASMVEPIVVTAPPCPFDITAIGSASGPSIIYVTPIVQQ